MEVSKGGLLTQRASAIHNRLAILFELRSRERFFGWAPLTRKRKRKISPKTVLLNARDEIRVFLDVDS